jgi:hypothetical protein
LLDKLKSKRLNSVLGGNLTLRNPTAQSLKIKSVRDKLTVLERRIKVLQALSTSGRLLDKIFSKLKALEVRVTKVNVLFKKINKTTAILNALCAKIRLA